MIPLSRPTINRGMKRAVSDVFSSEKLVLGESCFKFEEEFARYIGMDFAVSVNSGTSALFLAYKGIREAVKPMYSHYASVPSATFYSTVSMAVLNNYEVSFLDIDMKNYLCEEQRRDNKGVFVPVHLYGYPVDVEKFRELSRGQNFPIIEDCAQAHGAEINGKKVGGSGDCSIFSFYTTKNMTVAGDGGMLCTNNKKLAVWASEMRNDGAVSKYVFNKFGYSFRLNTINAAIGRLQLKYLDRSNSRRRILAAVYDKELSDIPEVTTPPKPTSIIKPVYHLYVIRVSQFGERDTLQEFLRMNGVDTLVHYPIPVHLQPSFMNQPNYVPQSLPNTVKWSKTVLSLPMFPSLKEANVKHICNLIRKFYGGKKYARARM